MCHYFPEAGRWHPRCASNDASDFIEASRVDEALPEVFVLSPKITRITDTGGRAPSFPESASHDAPRTREIAGRVTETADSVTPAMNSACAHHVSRPQRATWCAADVYVCVIISLKQDAAPAMRF
jgi:hypothetical protein